MVSLPHAKRVGLSPIDILHIGEDYVQLLLRNALQLLDIVKATFPHPFWANADAPFDCIHVDTTADDLACSWKAVLDGLPQDEVDPYDPQRLSRPITDVSFGHLFIRQAWRPN